MSSPLAADLIEAFDKLDGGMHPGFRPVHAKGVMYSGTFTPSSTAAKLTLRTACSAAVHSSHRTVLDVGGDSVCRRQRFEGGQSPGHRGPVSFGGSCPYRYHRPVVQRFSGPDRGGIPGIPPRGDERVGRRHSAAHRGILSRPSGGKGLRRGPEADSHELRPAGVFCHHRVQVHEFGRPEPVRPVPSPSRGRNRMVDSGGGYEEDGRLPCRGTLGEAGAVRSNSVCWCNWLKPTTSSPTPL